MPKQAVGMTRETLSSIRETQISANSLLIQPGPWEVGVAASRAGSAARLLKICVHALTMQFKRSM
jgi:hypothetical protein